MTARAIAVALCLFASAGCSSEAGPLDSSEVACDEFAGHAKNGMPAAERAEVVRSVGEVVDNAAEPIQDAYAGLVRTVGGSDSGYRLAADTFAQACFDNGWDG